MSCPDQADMSVMGFTPDEGCGESLSDGRNVTNQAFEGIPEKRSAGHDESPARARSSPAGHVRSNRPGVLDKGGNASTRKRGAFISRHSLSFQTGAAASSARAGTAR